MISGDAAFQAQRGQVGASGVTWPGVEGDGRASPTSRICREDEVLYEWVVLVLFFKRSFQNCLECHEMC